MVNLDRVKQYLCYNGVKKMFGKMSRHYASDISKIKDHLARYQDSNISGM